MYVPECQCADLGLNYCEIGDESICRDREMEELDKMLEQSDSILAPTLSALPTFSKVPRRQCVHSLDEYTLANGQTVYLSAVFDARLYRDWIPDIGFYLDGGWDTESESFTYLIPWEDYGLPLVTMSVFRRYVVSLFEHLNGSESVDIGCMGGHGRTGTFLACVDIASTNGEMKTRKAINRVRKNHCSHAIETREQEWFIDCFRAYWRGEDMPEKPMPKYVKHSAPMAPSAGANGLGAAHSAILGMSDIADNDDDYAYGDDPIVFSIPGKNGLNEKVIWEKHQSGAWTNRKAYENGTD